jgi:hypothetical protein
MSNVDNAYVYKGYRIHTSSPFSGICISMLVRFGTRNPLPANSLTDTVRRVPVECETEDQALRPARAYIGAGVREAPE